MIGYIVLLLVFVSGHSISDVKLFYNKQGELTIHELATHYRVGGINTSREVFTGSVVEYDADNRPFLRLNYDSLGIKNGHFWYQRFGLTLEGQFSNNVPTPLLPDSIMEFLLKKEKFVQSMYIRKRDYAELREILSPVPATDSMMAEGMVLRVVEENAEFPGGMNTIGNFINLNLVYPENARRMGITGRVFVEFTIEPDGAVDKVKAIKGIGAGCDEAAVRAVALLPDWKPGYQHRKPVRTKMTLPITFR